MNEIQGKVENKAVKEPFGIIIDGKWYNPANDKVRTMIGMNINKGDYVKCQLNEKGDITFITKTEEKKEFKTAKDEMNEIAFEVIMDKCLMRALTIMQNHLEKFKGLELRPSSEDVIKMANAMFIAEVRKVMEDERNSNR